MPVTGSDSRLRGPARGLRCTALRGSSGGFSGPYGGAFRREEDKGGRRPPKGVVGSGEQMPAAARREFGEARGIEAAEGLEPPRVIAAQPL